MHGGRPWGALFYVRLPRLWLGVVLRTGLAGLSVLGALVRQCLLAALFLVASGTFFELLGVACLVLVVLAHGILALGEGRCLHNVARLRRRKPTMPMQALAAGEHGVKSAATHREALFIYAPPACERSEERRVGTHCSSWL